jgi:hypothetical protein
MNIHSCAEVLFYGRTKLKLKTLVGLLFQDVRGIPKDAAQVFMITSFDCSSVSIHHFD